MATIDSSNWDETLVIEVTDDNGSTPTGIAKVQPIRVTWNNSSLGTGTGDAGFTTTNVSDESDIVVTDTDGSTTKPYQIPYIDTNNNEAWVWVYESWDRNNTEQGRIYAGTGDGTDYSWNGPHSSSGTGSSPWATGINSALAILMEGSAKDSSPANNDLGVEGATSASGQYGDGYDLDGSNDRLSTESTSQITWDDSNGMSFVTWLKPDFSDSTTDEIKVTRYKPSASSNWFMPIFKDGSLKLKYKASGAIAEISKTPNFTTDTWQHYAASFRPSNNELEGYKDGSSLGTASQSNTIGSTTSGYAIGSGTASGSGFGSLATDGTVDAVRVYEGEKNDAWFKADYDASPAGGQTFFSFKESVTQVSFSESMGVSDLRNETQDLFRDFAEDITLQDTDTKFLAKVLATEDLTFDETSSKKIIKNLDESLGVTANFDSNYGTLTGTVTLSGSPVQGAQVYAVRKSDLGFVGSDTTDSNGDYSIDSIKENQEVLVAVDYDDGSTFYGDEKSVNFQ